MAEHDRPVRKAVTARRRYLTLLFSDLSKSTDLAGGMEAEDYADLLSGLRLACEEAIPRHGGTIVQIQGDGVLAMFGYPEVGEYDGRRATEAALELHKGIRQLSADLRLPPQGALTMHTGIHAGLVLLDEGDALRGRFGLLGSAVNIAARLSDAAEGDEILVSEETLGAEAHFFETGERRILNLQGVSEPVAVRGVRGRTAIVTRFAARTQRGLAPFVGRSDELAILEDLQREVIAGSSRAVAIVAPAGVGKSRLAEEFLGRAAQDCQVHRGYCESYLSAEPLQPLLQMVRSLCGLSHGVSAAAAARALEETLRKVDPDLTGYRDALLRALSLGSAVAEEGDLESDNTIAAVRALFAALAARQPQVLFVDDWQWADDLTRQTLNAIRSLDQAPIMLVVTSRDAESSPVVLRDVRSLHLAPFTADEADETISRLLPGRDPILTAEIRTYSGGNPLFIEELCHSVAQSPSAIPQGWGRRQGRPPSGVAWLSALIESRVGRLPPEHAELVQMAAVIGNVIPAWLLEALSGYGAGHPIFQALSDQDLILPGEKAGTLRFKHGIARDVIYDSVGLRQRRALHLQIAEVLRRQGAAGAEEEFYESLAYHYAASGEATEAADYAQLAGDKAVAAAALDRAQLQYRAVLAALDQLEPTDERYRRRMNVSQKLAEVAVFDPSREQLAVLQRAIDLAAARDDQPAIAAAEYWMGFVAYALGEAAEAVRHFERALAGARQLGDQALALSAQVSLGQVSASACRYDEALRLMEAVTQRRAAQPSRGPAVGYAYSLACKGSVLGDQGRFAEAHDCFEDAIAAIRGAGHQVEGSVLCWRSGVWLWQGRWEEARQTAAEARRIAERVKSLYLYTMSLSLGAYASWMQRADPGLVQTMVDSTSWLASRDRGLFISLNYGWLADALATSGRWADSRIHAARALRRGRRGDRIGQAMAYRALARGAAAGEGSRPASHYLDLAMKTAHLRGSPHEVAVTQLCDAQIRLGRGELAPARSLLDEAAGAFEALQMPWHLAEATRLRRTV